MYGLQVFNAQTLQVLLRCRHAAVPQDPRKVEQVSTGSKVAHRERVPEGVKAHADTCNVQPSPKVFQVAQHVTLILFAALESWKHQNELVLSQPAI